MNLPQHRLKLCPEHYTEWVTRMVQRTIAKYGMFSRDERVLVAVSGGKDSLSLWDILDRLGYETTGLYIHLGIGHDGYSDASQERIAEFAAARPHLSYQVVNLAETYGVGMPALKATGRGKHLCAVCGLVKRHIMNRIACEGGYAAIATGHNLDDEVAVLLQNTLRWEGGYLRRQAPVLPSTHPMLARKVKPFCHLYEREAAGYALVRGINYLDQECPYSARAKTIFLKGLLNQLERRSPGAKLQYYLSFLRSKEEGLFAPKPDLAEDETCRVCGQPTTAGGLCAFCRIWESKDL